MVVKIRFASNGGLPRSSSQHTLQSPRCFVTPFPPLSIRPWDIRASQRTPTASRLLVPARRPQSPKLRRRCIANPHFVSLCLHGTVAAAAATPPPSRLSPSPSYPSSPFRQRYVFSPVTAAAAFAGSSSFAADLQLG
jgi:hypothetical protein